MKKSILFIIPSLMAGGAERTLINLLKRIDYSLYQIDLLVVLNQGKYLNEVPRSVELIPLFNNKHFVRILSYLQKKIGFNYVYRYIISRRVTKNYDIGISFLDSNFTDLLFLIEGIAKRYTWVHASYKNYNNYYKYYRNKNYREKIIRDRYKSLDGIFFVSNDAMKDFIEIFGEYPNMRVIYNVIDTDRIKKMALEEISFSNDIFTFVSIGSLLPVKGFDRLIRASRIVADRGHKFKLVILGTGPEYKKLDRLIMDLKLTSIVDLIGFVGNPYSYMKKGDIFIMSSITEALPTVLCEAMVLGKPVLVTNCSGCREIVANGEYGLMAEQNDIDLADKMIEYLSNSDIVDRYGTKSIERSVIFDDNRIRSEYYKIFDS
jgi:glycosyltransferase involved in cell wall biosynthesis